MRVWILYIPLVQITFYKATPPCMLNKIYQHVIFLYLVNASWKISAKLSDYQMLNTQKRKTASFARNIVS